MSDFSGDRKILKCTIGSLLLNDNISIKDKLFALRNTFSNFTTQTLDIHASRTIMNKYNNGSLKCVIFYSSLSNTVTLSFRKEMIKKKAFSS